MPKKTKKEKMLAHYHKKLRLLENRQTADPPVQAKIINEISMPPIESKIKTLINEPLIQELKNSNQYFFSDLKKSLLLITLIIGLEISLYFAKLYK
jgi:hypothetical protein